jgi:hypothetical protein
MDPREVARTFESILAREEKRNARRPVLVTLADVEPEEVRWLWKPYIPIGKLTLLEGDPGRGKTWLALAIAAALTSSRPLPGSDSSLGEACYAQSVLYMTAEDGLGDTLRPRLDGLGADVSRVVVLDGIRGKEGKHTEFTLQDLDVLEEALSEVKPALVVVDPIQGYLGADVDMHRANEVRPLLAGLARLAERFGCAVVAIRHLRKSASDRAIHRGLGSIDFAAAARSILLVAEEPGNSLRRVLAHSKSNLAPAGSSLTFDIRDGAFTWTGESDLSAEDLLATPDQGVTARPRNSAVDFLAEALSEGPVPVSELREQARAAGLSWRTVERAKAELNARAQRQGFGRGGVWVWELPIDRQVAK